MSGSVTNSILARSSALSSGAGSARKFALGDTIVEANTVAREVLFPTSAMASCVRHLGDGSIIEVGIIGFEGMIGMEAIFGADAQPNQVTAQIAGEVIPSMWRRRERLFSRMPAFAG